MLLSMLRDQWIKRREAQLREEGQQASERRRYWRIRGEAFERLGGKCKACPETCPWFLEIDHIVPVRRQKAEGRECGVSLCRKVLSLSGSVAQKRYRLLCANCHRLLGRRQPLN